MSDEWQKDRECIEAATPPNWTVETEPDPQHEYPDHWVIADGHPNIEPQVAICSSIRDAAFIARARTRWLAALDRIAELEAVLREVERSGVRWFDDGDGRRDDCDGYCPLCMCYVDREKHAPDCRLAKALGRQP